MDKRQRERVRKQQRLEKEQRRVQRAAQRQQRALEAGNGADADLDGMVAGPQPGQVVPSPEQSSEVK